MNISGSAAFFAKADLGLTVHLDKDKTVEIHCWKCRFKWIGTTGMVNLDYDVPTGCYSDVAYKDFTPAPEVLTGAWSEGQDDWDL